ncbi:MAG: hypothetical protein K0R57_996 [Paenibacillaceae bacterium]|nr:hypothetical protein [Paenibacillaceae bacterium]
MAAVCRARACSQPGGIETKYAGDGNRSAVQEATGLKQQVEGDGQEKGRRKTGERQEKDRRKVGERQEKAGEGR